jgi:hypothetical protein
LGLAGATGAVGDGYTYVAAPEPAPTAEGRLSSDR